MVDGRAVLTEACSVDRGSSCGGRIGACAEAASSWDACDTSDAHTLATRGVIHALQHEMIVWLLAPRLRPSGTSCVRSVVRLLMRTEMLIGAGKHVLPWPQEQQEQHIL